MKESARVRHVDGSTTRTGAHSSDIGSGSLDSSAACIDAHGSDFTLEGRNAIGNGNSHTVARMANAAGLQQRLTKRKRLDGMTDGEVAQLDERREETMHD